MDKGARIPRIFNSGKSSEGLNGVALSPSEKDMRIRRERKEEERRGKKRTKRKGEEMYHL